MRNNFVELSHNSYYHPELYWWIEIFTAKPLCLYYFGPFESKSEAEEATDDFMKDLQQENTEVIELHIKQCNPQKLTFEEEELRNFDRRLFPLPVLLNHFCA